MLLRALLLGLLPLMCIACANEPAPRVMGYQATLVPAPSAQTGSTRGIPDQPPPVARKNMADKVLAAIALERVTGLKPDPSRFIE